jgi:pimeloyl-ACP methyl ester carboxylesterase
MPTTTINGLKHFYEDMGSGEPLVMLHGANSSSRTLEEHFPELSQHFRVIAPDMRSMGQSEHVSSLSKSAWVDDLEALLDELNVQKPHIYGSSLGSRVGMRFAIEHPERTRSLILTAPHTYLTAALNDSLNSAGGEGENLSPEAQARMARIHGDDWKAAYRNYFSIRNQSDLQDYYNLQVGKPMMQVIGRFTDSVSKIRCPILVVQSENGTPSGRGTYHHALELKEELPDQVSLAIVPAFGATGVPGETMRQLIRQFTAFVASKEAAVPATT